MPEMTMDELAEIPFVQLRKWVREALDLYTITDDRVSGRKVKQLTAGVMDELDRLKGDPRTWSDPTPEAVFRKVFARVA